MILLYIDPGTGAMLFTTIICLVTTASFALRKWGLKFKYFVLGGRVIDSGVVDEKKDIVIFSDHKRYWNVFKPICDELDSRKIISFFWTASPDDPALEENYDYVKCEFIGEGNHAFARLNMMNAYVCLSTTPGLDVYQWKRSKKTDYYVHVPHGISAYTMYRMFGLDFYDAILMNSELLEQTIRKLERIRTIHEKELFVVGCTYLDAMLKRIHGKSRQEKRTLSKELTILLAPSWGPNSILRKYGRDFLAALRDTGYNIIVRPHPQSISTEKQMLEALEREFQESHNWHWNYDNDNFDVLSKTDVMISDFSGVILDYIFVFDGGLIYTDVDYDPSVYDACWLDEPTWYEQILPQIGRKLDGDDISDIRSIIEDTVANCTYIEERKKLKEEAWMYKGEAAKRTVDYLLDKVTVLKEN